MAEQVVDAVQPGAALAVRRHDEPGRLIAVRVIHHVVLGVRVFVPFHVGLQVHFAELPALQGILDPVPEPPFLFLRAHREPVLDQPDAGPHEHALELGAGPKELAVFLLGAEPHYPVDARAVVPAPVEEDDFAGRRQVRDVPLEVPLRLFPFCRLGQCGHAADAGIEPRGDAGDGAALAGRVAPFEDDHHFLALVDHPFLELGQFDLQAGQFRLVGLAAQFLLLILLHGGRRLLVYGFFRHCSSCRGHGQGPFLLRSLYRSHPAEAALSFRPSQFPATQSPVIVKRTPIRPSSSISIWYRSP